MNTKLIKKIRNTAVLCSSLFLLTSVILGCDSSAKSEDQKQLDWLDEEVPSLCDTYEDYFSHVGIACEYGISGYSETEFAKEDVQKGIKKHCSTITMGNEFKPQFICQWWGNTPALSGETFTASNGVTIETPVLKGFGNVDAILSTCKKNNLQMRGHVLVWHSQTDNQFFYKDYNAGSTLVDKATMTARQEWYIKTVLEHVKKWETDNNDGNHIIWAWDVVNEAVGDGTSDLRTGSKWYEIYGNDEFIVNAFRFANKYADSDILLCYNDYNETYDIKRKGMVNIVKAIQAASTDNELPARIDAMGFQSHISVNTSIDSFQAAINDFIALGVDVQVTELDVATETKYIPSQLAEQYGDLFKLFIKNRKTSSANGISSITIWGINDENTWLNSESQKKWHGNCDQYPLLFKKDKKGNYVTKQAFWSVIDAATEE